jgi:hypothetical protein
MFSRKEFEEDHLFKFEGEISSERIDAILLKIESIIDNVKWMKSVLRVSYDLLTSSYGSGDKVEYILRNSNGNYQIYCTHNKVPPKVAEFIDKAINKLKDYDENKLRDLIKRLTDKHSPLTNKGVFFEDIIWSIYNIYRRKYAKIEVNYKYLDIEFIPMEFMVSFHFNA